MPFRGRRSYAERLSPLWGGHARIAAQGRGPLLAVVDKRLFLWFLQEPLLGWEHSLAAVVVLDERPASVLPRGAVNTENGP